VRTNKYSPIDDIKLSLSREGRKLSFLLERFFPVLWRYHRFKACSLGKTNPCRVYPLT